MLAHIDNILCLLQAYGILPSLVAQMPSRHARYCLPPQARLFTTLSLRSKLDVYRNRRKPLVSVPGKLLDSPNHKDPIRRRNNPLPSNHVTPHTRS